LERRGFGLVFCALRPPQSRGSCVRTALNENITTFFFTSRRAAVMLYDEQVVARLIGPKSHLMSIESGAIGLIPEPGLTDLSAGLLALFDPIKCMLDASVMDEVEILMRQAASLGSSGALARRKGDEAAADDFFRDAFALSLKAANRQTDAGPHPARLDVLRAAVLLALDCGEAAEARRLVAKARDYDPSIAFSEEWAQLRDVTAWSDEWLIAAVRRDPPDEGALDALAERYWKPLFGRCQMLTLKQEEASDLAQQAWCRVLRARHTLKPGGNFPAFLTTIATNLWRDSHRSARRAGPLAEHRIASLDAAFPSEDGESSMLAETLPDFKALRAEEQRLLTLDLDQALEQLTPLLRDVLVSRLLAGESCAEIGRRYQRTEQTISAWVRQAVREMKRHLKELGHVTKTETKQ
jgi:RNA polymerase sigma factor (sigma-70 family)